MKNSKIIISLVLLTSISVLAAPPLNNAKPMTAKAYFSPNGGCTEAIVSELEKSKTEVLVQSYTFTSKDIAAALVSAHKRGIKVHVILDKSNLTGDYSSADFLAHSGIQTLIDSEHAIAHNKVMIIDGQTVITGSFNFT